MDDEKIVAESFKEFIKVTKDPVAAAILTLVTRLHSPLDVRVSAEIDTVSHVLCMGIRHGLFGAHASQNADVRALELSGEVKATSD